MDKKDYMKIRQTLDLSLKSYAWLSYLFIDVVLVGTIVGIWNSANSWWRLSAVIPLLSIFMFRNFSFMHDAVHGALSKNKFLNDTLGLWSGCWSFLPYSLWKKSHLEHHYWSGNLQKDPVMALTLILPKAPAWVLGTLTFFWRAWLPLIGLMQQGVFWTLSFKNTWADFKLSSVLSLVAPIVAWGFVLSYSHEFNLYAVLPAFFLYLLAVEIVNLPHHLQMEMVSGDDRLPIWEQYVTARTCLYPKWFAHFVVLNFNYHAEHHMFPEAPWYHLPRLHQHLVSQLDTRYKTDPYFQWTLENRQKSILKVLERPSSPTQPTKKVS